tara:strand:- start:347 stop:1219 length:873 start_codon:yes stop_codon:yes gene_type:complete
MEFLKEEIYEARMLRDDGNARLLTYTDCCQRLYLVLLCLELMRHFPKYSDVVKRYAGNTTDRNNYNIFRMFSTDLHNFMYFVNGDDSAMDKLKDPEAAKTLRSKTRLPIMAINRYLIQLSNNSQPSSPSDLFIKLETALNIKNTDYKNIRRLITNMKSLSKIERESSTTKLLFAVRAKLRSSDIISDFEKFVKDKGLETRDVKDNEPTVSTSDLGSGVGALQFYRLLVGAGNLMQAKRFLDLAQSRQSIPSTFLDGYMPIIKMVDDIVSSGPTYVQALRVLHQRAKKQRK